MKHLPLSSVRGRIRAYIERHAYKLGTDVLEVGSRMTNPDTWWIVNRDLARGQWTGIDMQPGHGWRCPSFAVSCSPGRGWW